jgi:hypothetical protein
LTAYTDGEILRGMDDREQHIEAVMTALLNIYIASPKLKPEESRTILITLRAVINTLLASIDGIEAGGCRGTENRRL